MDTISRTLAAIDQRAPRLPDENPIRWNISLEALSLDLWAQGLPHHHAAIRRALRSAVLGNRFFPWSPSMMPGGRVGFQPTP